MSGKLIKPLCPYSNVPLLADRLNPMSLVSTDALQMALNSLRRTGSLGQICSRAAAHHRVTPLHGSFVMEVSATGLGLQQLECSVNAGTWMQLEARRRY